MDKYFVCLANSYKHGGRCIAGVEVERKQEHWRIVRNEYGCPKWIRPLARTTNIGEIPKEMAMNFFILEIVKLEGVLECGYDAQTENVYFEKILSIGKRYEKTSSLLEKFMDESHKHILYNYGKAVSPEVYQNRAFYSILLIRAFSSEVYMETEVKDFPRYRIKFSYRGHSYDFPITDPLYVNDLRMGRCSTGYKGTIFITCSLGVEHEGWHPKLAACVFELDSISKDVDAGKNLDNREKEDWFAGYGQELHQLIVQRDAITEKINELRARITQYMEARQIRKVKSSMFSVDFSPAKILMQFDTKAFRKDYEELYKSYCKPKHKGASIVVKRVYEDK